MPLSTRTVNSVDIIALSGRLDAEVAPAVRDELKTAIGSGGGKVLIDLSSVKFIDSSGLSALVTALKEIHLRGGSLGLLKANPTVRSLLELTRLHRVFPLFEDEEQACTALTGVK